MSDTVPEETDRAAAETAAAEEISLRVDDVTKIFDEKGDRVVAVEGVSIDIRDGEFLVLVGPSGCGKTTTLRTIAGLESPTEGRIIINDEDVSGQEPRERDIAMVFQNYALYPHKTVRENLSFPLEVRKYPKDEIQEKVVDTATLLGIEELLDRHPSDLSGGQQQRVALGRAIVRDPEVFLFDEPLSNLDAKLRIQMRTELNKLHERVGKTSVYVTHDQAEAMTLGDRVVVMNDGQIQQIAPPQEVYDQPTNRFVAGFIGEPPMNFFGASVEERDGDRYAVSPAFELKLPEQKVAKLEGYSGDLSRVEFGVRPEDFFDTAVHDENEFEAVDTFDATVAVVEPMGAYIDLALVPVGMEGEEHEFTARVDADSTAEEGDILTLAVDMSKIHIFDGRTGNNLTR